jgi:hypothetical protein
MGKAKKLRAGSHKKQVPPTGGPSQAEIEDAANADYSTLAPADAQMFKGVRLRNCLAPCGTAQHD